MKKTVLITAHLLFWIFNLLSAEHLFFIVSVFPTMLHKGPYLKLTHVETTNPQLFFLLAIGAVIFYTAYFSFNLFLKRPFLFILLLGAYFLYMVIHSLPAELFSWNGSLLAGPVFYFNVFGFLFKAYEEWFEDRKLKIELERDRTVSQLELLKSKIDPHFLFNNLNNIDVFIEEDPKLASQYLKKLSHLLRFMLYEANADKIPLTKEIEYTSQYIDLQKIRTANMNFVKFEVNGDASNKKISPMILIHFIENAFKYAGNKKINNAVEVRLDISEKHLSFFCKNHVSSTKDLGSTQKGLGIQLLTQKLDLIYKKDYKLVTKEENNWYIVQLEIALDED